MRVIFILLSLCLVLGSCVRRTKSRYTADLQADKKLNAKYSQDEAEEAQKSLEEIQEKQLQEQKRQLERQITDPQTE